MRRSETWLSAAAPLAALLVAACGDSGNASSEASAGNTSAASAASGAGAAGATTTTGAGGAATTSAGPGGASVGSGGAPACDGVKAAAEAYKAAHPGNGGKDWDINAKTPAEIAADPDAQQLLALCGADQRPIIPLLAWEYGGNDHSWIMPEASALYYCVYTPVNPSTANWSYDAATDHVVADVYIGCPELNPCKDMQGKDQVIACLGDPSNIEILVDTASLNDGMDVGLNLAEATTDLKLILDGGTKVDLYMGL